MDSECGFSFADCYFSVGYGFDVLVCLRGFVIVWFGVVAGVVDSGVWFVGAWCMQVACLGV